MSSIRSWAGRIAEEMRAGVAAACPARRSAGSHEASRLVWRRPRTRRLGCPVTGDEPIQPAWERVEAKLNHLGEVQAERGHTLAQLNQQTGAGSKAIWTWSS